MSGMYGCCVYVVVWLGWGRAAHIPMYGERKARMGWTKQLQQTHSHTLAASRSCYPTLPHTFAPYHTGCLAAVSLFLLRPKARNCVHYNTSNANLSYKR